MTPTNDLLPSLMVEVCLVLAPDVNFLLNPRKQGYFVGVVFLSFFLSQHHLKELSLDTQRARTTVLELHAHSMSYAHKLTKPRCALKRPFTLTESL